MQFRTEIKAKKSTFTSKPLFDEWSDVSFADSFSVKDPLAKRNEIKGTIRCKFNALRAKHNGAVENK